MKNTMICSGLYIEKDIKEGWEKYEQESPELFEYINSFHWILLNYFDSCRVVISGNVVGDKDATKTKDVKLVETVVDFVKRLGNFIPVVSEVINLMTDAFKAVI